MIISPCSTAVFIEVPKTGSTSAAYHLINHGWRQTRKLGSCRLSRHSYFERDSDVPSDVRRVIGTIRNPWDRVASAWRADRRGTDTIEEYLKKFRFSVADVDMLSFPNSRWLMGCTDIIRYEHLDEDWANLSTSFLLPRGCLPLLNASRLDIVPVWTNAAEMLVAKRFAIDIVLWGYSGPGTPPTRGPLRMDGQVLDHAYRWTKTGPYKEG